MLTTIRYTHFFEIQVSLKMEDCEKKRIIWVIFNSDKLMIMASLNLFLSVKMMQLYNIDI